MDSKTKVYEHKPEGFSPKVEIAAVYVNVQEKLLLLELSQNKAEAGRWGVPAGKLEANEPAISGAKRELFEETGIDMASEGLFHSFGKLYVCKPDVHYIYHLFEIRLDNLPPIQLSDEHLSHKWVSRQEAESLPLMNGGRQALDFYYQIQNRIEKVENGLVPAICIQGRPILKKNLFEQMKEMKIPAVSLAVINDGKIEWTKAYGVLSSNEHRKADTHTRFQAGSVSKPVAAFAILSLVQKGLLDLDEEVNKKLISWKIPDSEYTKTTKITLRHLLSHSSGLNVIGFDGYTKNEPIPTITQTLDGLAPANNPPVRSEFVPFSKMSYSGGGYNVAQQLVEDVTKLPFAQFMQRTLLSPLEMTESTFEYLDSAQFSNAAQAHPINDIPMEGGWKSYPEAAAAGLWTTPTDLAKWLIEIQEGLTTNKNSILNKNLLHSMSTPQVVVHGLGPVVNGQGENLELAHKGRTDGFTCGFVSFPYLKQGAVVMVNASNASSFVEDLLRSIASEYKWPSYSVKIRKAIELPASTLEKYAGRYGWGDKPNDIYDLIIFREENELFWKMGNGSTVSQKLYAESKDRFFLLDTGYDIVFQETKQSITKLTIIVQAGFEREFKKF